MKRKFFITDVFCEGKYSGNQLATIVDCDGLTSAEMQKIAREFNFSETTFLLGGDSTAGYDVRIFTPARELPFAGHPTLGTAFLARDQFEANESRSVTLNLGVGKIPVTFADDGVLWMKQREPEFGEIKSTVEVADALSIESADINPNFPCQFVSTGLNFLIVPLNSMTALKRSSLKRSLGLGVLVFSTETYANEHTLSARVFAGAGVGEDAATGSANGDLASYLVEHQFLGEDKIALSVGQGYEIQRPSTLRLIASKADNGEFDINVGGRVRIAATGELLV